VNDDATNAGINACFASTCWKLKAALRDTICKSGIGNVATRLEFITSRARYESVRVSIEFIRGTIKPRLNDDRPTPDPRSARRYCHRCLGDVCTYGDPHERRRGPRDNFNSASIFSTRDDRGIPLPPPPSPGRVIALSRYRRRCLTAEISRPVKPAERAYNGKLENVKARVSMYAGSSIPARDRRRKKFPFPIRTRFLPVPPPPTPPPPAE
jgi:hypothetical protein